MYESQRNLEPLMISSSQSEFSVDTFKAESQTPRHPPELDPAPPRRREEDGEDFDWRAAERSKPKQVRCKSQELLVTEQDSMDSTTKVINIIPAVRELQ